LKLNRQNGRKKKLKKKINHCFFCRQKLNGEKNEHHHPPRSFKEFATKKTIFKVHYRCHILYNSIYKYLLEAGYSHGEILQIIHIPDFRNKDFQETIFKFPEVSLYRFLILKKKFSIQQIVKMVKDDDIILEMEKQKDESNFTLSQIDSDIIISEGSRFARRQIGSFLRFLGEKNKYRL